MATGIQHSLESGQQQGQARRQGLYCSLGFTWVSRLYGTRAKPYLKTWRCLAFTFPDHEALDPKNVDISRVLSCHEYG